MYGYRDIHLLAHATPNPHTQHLTHTSQPTQSKDTELLVYRHCGMAC